MEQLETASGTELIDTHAHLDMSPLGSDLDAVIGRAREAGVTGIITIGIDPSSSIKGVEIARNYPDVYATVGVHPHDADRTQDGDLEMLRELSRNECVVAWGEIGLDFAKEYSSKESQERIFRRQLGLAAGLNLPVIIHARNAHERVMEILLAEGFQGSKVVFHCFAGDVKMAERVLESGFFISVTGIVTFPKADALRKMIASVPLERLLLETDCPFLSPVPYRGKTNEPSRLVYIAKAVAEVKGVDYQEVARCTTENERAFFALPSP